MPRYCVNATLEVDAWTYVDADSEDAALEAARVLDTRCFEMGEVVGVSPETVELDS